MTTYIILVNGQEVGKQELDPETARKYENTDGVAIRKA